MQLGDRLRSLDSRVLGQPKPEASRMERYWDRPWGWLVPFGLPWKLGRRDGLAGQRRSTLTMLLVFDVWSIRIYERARAQTTAEQRRAG